MRPDPKLAALVDHLERAVLAEPGEKAIVFTEYRDTLEALRETLATHPVLGGSSVELVGGLTSKQRLTRIARFEQPECRLLLATDAASEGLNLQRHCHRLYHLELPWNPNRLEQRNGRIDRHGQTRPPVIAYLHYADSPEDRVLDRLIQRISAMHDDRVSTPDILGVLSATRLEDVLASMSPDDAPDSVAGALLRVFDEAASAFTRDVAPLLVAGGQQGEGLDSMDATSADPLFADDDELERHVEAALGPALRPGAIPQTFSVEVPRHLQGPGVTGNYPCVTFRRSIAVRYPSADVTFVHRLHPLFLAMAAHARETLAAERDPAGAPRVAVRRHSSARDGPFVAFTFIHQTTPGVGVIMAAGFATDCRPVGDDRVRAVMAPAHGPVGEVSWSECARVVGPLFDRLSREARRLAHRRLEEAAARERESKARAAGILRVEAAGYRDDRLAELADEEAAERAGPREQAELFREAATNWAARRAGVATHYDQRLREIDAWAAVPEPAEPQPLGALVVFPEE